MNIENLLALENIIGQKPFRKRKYWLCNRDQHQNFHRQAITIKDLGQWTRNNQSAICTGRAEAHWGRFHVINLKMFLANPIQEINNFCQVPEVFWPSISNNQATHCWGGVDYSHEIRFNCLSHAVRYLKIYFDLGVCRDNFPPLDDFNYLANMQNYLADTEVYFMNI